MIKSIFAALIVCTFISCNNNSTTSSADVDSTTDADNTNVKNVNSNPDVNDTLNKVKADTTKTFFADLRDWEIDKPNFDRMEGAQCPFTNPLECLLRAHKKYKKALRLIESHYPILDWNYVYVPGRFEEIDIERYKRTRKRRNPNNEKVAGRATLLLIVSPKDKTLTNVQHYFDICLICPPPNTGTCDLDDPLPIKKSK